MLFDHAHGVIDPMGQWYVTRDFLLRSTAPLWSRYAGWVKSPGASDPHDAYAVNIGTGDLVPESLFRAWIATPPPGWSVLSGWSLWAVDDAALRQVTQAQIGFPPAPEWVPLIQPVLHGLQQPERWARHPLATVWQQTVGQRAPMALETSYAWMLDHLAPAPREDRWRLLSAAQASGSDPSAHVVERLIDWMTAPTRVDRHDDALWAVRLMRDIALWLYWDDANDMTIRGAHLLLSRLVDIYEVALESQGMVVFREGTRPVFA